MTGRRWLRRNAWGLVALPVVAAVAVAANSHRLQDHWWDRGLHEATTGGAGELVTFTQEYEDAVGTTSRTLAVRVGAVAPAAVDDDTALPDGARAVAVDLEFEADPDQSLAGCQLALEDVDGNRYEFDPRWPGLEQDPFPCLPFETPGPLPPLLEGETRDVEPGQERPASWSTEPVVVVPEAARISRVLLWWERPQHLALEVREQPAG